MTDAMFGGLHPALAIAKARVYQTHAGCRVQSCAISAAANIPIFSLYMTLLLEVMHVQDLRTVAVIRCHRIPQPYYSSHDPPQSRTRLGTRLPYATLSPVWQDNTHPRYVLCAGFLDNGESANAERRVYGKGDISNATIFAVVALHVLKKKTALKFVPGCVFILSP